MVSAETAECQSFKTADAAAKFSGTRGNAKMIQQVDRLLDHTAGDIMAEKTRMLQAITAKSPDRTAADFYLSGMEEKSAKHRPLSIKSCWTRFNACL